MQKEDTKEILIKILDACKDKLPQERYNSTIELVQVGEEGIALENLCSNIDDFEITLSQDSFDKIQYLAVKMGLHPDSWEFVTEWVTKTHKD